MLQLPLINRLVVAAAIAFVAAQVLGLLFWAGYAHRWLPLHIAAGLLLVTALWLTTAWAWTADVARYRLLIAGFWGLFVIGLGFWQADLLVGEHHRTVRALHMISGVAAMTQIRRMAWGIREYMAGAAAAPQS
jgi:hypothetical protein